MGPICEACSLVSSAFGATMCVFWIRIQPRWRAGPRTHETVGCAICALLQLTILILTSYLSIDLRRAIKVDRSPILSRHTCDRR